MLRRFRETIKNCRTTEVIVDVLCFNSNFKPKTMFEIIYVPAISAHLLFLVIIKTLFGSSYFGNLDIQPHRYGFEVNLREKKGLANTKKMLVLLPLKVRALFKQPTYTLHRD